MNRRQLLTSIVAGLMLAPFADHVWHAGPPEQPSNPAASTTPQQQYAYVVLSTLTASGYFANPWYRGDPSVRRLVELLPFVEAERATRWSTPSYSVRTPDGGRLPFPSV